VNEIGYTQYMKYLLSILLGITPFFVSGATITDYYVDIEVQDNAELAVSEQVDYLLEQGDLERKIEHIIDLRYSRADGKRQSMRVRDVKAFVGEQELVVNFQIDEKRATIAIMPDEDGFDQSSKIELQYTVEGAIAYYEQHNQVYWPVFTSVTRSPVSLVAGSVRIPSEFRVLRAECVVTRDSKEYRCNVPSRLEGGYVSYFAHKSTEAKDEVFLDVQFNTGVEVTVRSVSWSYVEWFLVFVGILCALGLLGVMFVYARMWVHSYFEQKKKKSPKKQNK